MPRRTPIAPDLLVSIPHAGVACPPEIPLASLSSRQQELAGNVDWYTDRLYAFGDLLGNQEVLFPYSQVYINVNRHPGALDECVPLRVDGVPVYRRGREPHVEERRALVRRHHAAFHRSIARADKTFVLDGHSTVTGHEDAGGDRVSADIILSDRQRSALDPPGGIRTAPDGYLECYVLELERRLPRQIRIAANTTYVATYGHVMAAHGWDGRRARGRRAPLLLQETNEALYVKDGAPDVTALEELRRVFAEAVAAMLRRMQG